MLFTLAKNQISPLLDQLITELEAEGCATQKAYFARIRGRFANAHDDLDLSTTIVGLSSGTAIGFQLPSTADVLLNRILEKVAVMIVELEGSTPDLH